MTGNGSNSQAASFCASKHGEHSTIRSCTVAECFTCCVSGRLPLGARHTYQISSIPPANDWGWLGDGSSAHPYVLKVGPYLNWTMLPQASKVCKEYPHCKCKKGCRRNCPCFNKTLRCTKV